MTEAEKLQLVIDEELDRKGQMTTVSKYTFVALIERLKFMLEQHFPPGEGWISKHDKMPTKEDAGDIARFGSNRIEVWCESTHSIFRVAWDGSWNYERRHFNSIQLKDRYIYWRPTEHESEQEQM